MKKIYFAASVALSALFIPFTSAALAQAESGVVAAVNSGWWGREMAETPGLLGSLDGAAPVAIGGGIGATINETNTVNEFFNLDPRFAKGEFPHEMVDLDGDGNVSRNELMGMLEGGRLRVEGAAPIASAVLAEDGAGSNNPMSVLSARREARFAQTDGNQNGGVDFEELMQLRRDFMAERGNENAGNEARVRKQARRIMGRLDSNGDQMISREELAEARGSRFMSRLDADGDGQISPAEWEVTLQ